jgi:hypothetical protein
MAVRQVQAHIEAGYRIAVDLDLAKFFDNVPARHSDGGEFVALRFLESLGQFPSKVDGKSNPGFDLVEGDRKTQVKVITEENQRGTSVRLRDPWNQFVLIDLGEHYQPRRIGILTKEQHQKACGANLGWSATPVVRRSMLGPRGLFSKYGAVYCGDSVAV